VRRLRKEGRQDLLHVLALTLWAVRTLGTMLRKWLDPIENPVAVATAIFVGRHPVLRVRLRAQGSFVARLSIGSRYP
jgi:hypothetical protein